jgi:glycosyltransferase involved in cell wall biosynthesis
VGGISVVVTVRDDREELAQLLDSLAHQTRAPDELVVVDGGSTDGTVELLESWSEGAGFPLRILVEPGANISAGRNIAIRAAAHDWIACTDAGCRPVPEWLEELDRARRDADLVAGFYIVVGETPFEEALAVALYPSHDELRDPPPLVHLYHRMFGRGFEASHAATRSCAFSKRAWEAVGGFPEELYAGEDVAFSLAVVDRGFPAVVAPDAAVTWRPRPSWAANARMYRTYARGDARRGTLSRHLIRLGAWTIALVLVTAGGRTGRALVAAGALADASLPLVRAARRGIPVHRWWRIPLVIAMKDLSQIAGALEGFADELAGRPQPAPR